MPENQDAAPAAAAETDDAELVTNLLVPQPATATDEKEPDLEHPATTTDTPPADLEDDEPPAEQPGSQATQPGTPDKALQKYQQDLAAVTRKLDALLAKQDGGEALTPAEQQQATQAARKLDTLRAAVKGQTFDPYEHSGDVVEALGETDQTVADLKARLERLEAEKQQGAEQQWTSWAKQTFPDVDVEKVRQKAIADAQETLGEDATAGALSRLATRFFTERATGAQARIGKAAAETTAPAGKKAKAGAPVTDGGAQVQVQQAPAVSDERERELGLIHALIKKD